MDGKFKICAECGKKQLLDLFPPTSNTSLYSDHGCSYICSECIAKKIDVNRLETVDKMCQFLDIPFDADKWIEMSKDYSQTYILILDYCSQVLNGKYADNDWYYLNQIWEKCREYNSVLDQLTSLHGDLLIYLRKKWGHIDDFNLEDYMRMEEYERHTLSHYPFKDEARRDMVRKLAKLSAISDHCISNGNNKEATTVLQSYNSLMKELGIRTETANDENTINTLSELVSYLERTGFLVNYRVTENRDIVDKPLENMQQYVKRLFTDSSETVNEMYNSKVLSAEAGTEITDEDIDALYAESEEDGIEYEDTLDEIELEKMFRQVENEFK